MRNLVHRLRSSLLLLLLASCQEGVVYHSYQPLPKEGWQRSDTLVFCPSDSLPAGRYEVQACIRHSEEYPYRDLWLAVLRAPADSLLPPVADTLHLYLADEAGEWQGRGIAGLYQYVRPLSRPLVVTAADSGRVALRLVHLMQDASLRGIVDAGIQLRQQPDR